MPFFELDLEHKRGNRHRAAGLSVREAQSLDGMASRLWRMSQKKNLHRMTQHQLYMIILEIEDLLWDEDRLISKLVDFQDLREAKKSLPYYFEDRKL